MAALEAERDEPLGPAVGAAPLLASKRAIPLSPPRLVARPRLTACLRPPDLHSPRGYPRLALVVAPAGSGKSSLVSEWCHQHEDTRVAWLSLEASDSEPTRFLLYLSAALETVAPEPAGRVRSLLESPQPPPFDYALTLLLNGLAGLTKPVTLVLDDYHEIEAPAVHQLLTFLIEHLPPTLF